MNRNTSIMERFKVWYSIYQRIRFFKKMYPLSAIAKDIFLFPLDYVFNHRSIHSVRNVTMAVTHRCNIRCEMCYFHQQLKDIYDLPLNLYKQIIDSVKMSHPCIILSGGEPFLHADLIDMVMYAKEAKLPTQIFTNGILAFSHLTDTLVKIGLDYINFTLLGDSNSHSQVARVPNIYEKFINNLEYFANHRGNTKIILNYTVTPRALNDINHTVELVKRYNLDGLRVQHYNFLLPGEFKAQESVMQEVFGVNSNTHEIEGLLEESSIMADRLLDFKKYLSKEIPNIPVQWTPTLTETEMKNWYSKERFKTQRKCLYPWRGILVDANGKIYPCSKIYLALGDVADDGVFNAWNSAEMKKFRAHLKKNLFPACSRCCKL
ncbi:MAG: radical SAM protein [Candidatus Omnitrophica bacterium]|nr:radical SAM protein [Candidatus Omnitrophota bacterium]